MASFNEWLVLTESKQSIVELGFPEIISKILFEKYGKLATLIAKWYKDVKEVPSITGNPDWWARAQWSALRRTNLYDLTYMYAAATDPETYKQAAQKMELRVPNDIDQDYVDQQKSNILQEIKQEFFDDYFFNYHLIQDITTGKLTDVAAYKRLPFYEAQKKYDRRNHFKDTAPTKVYPNGFKWINVGKRSTLVGTQLANCGSVGVMSMDPDRTLLVLFGPNNKSHVIVTYSPNEKRISGDEGPGYSPVKDKYHDYIIDLAKTLGAHFDTSRTKSDAMALKWTLHGHASSIEPINTGTTFDNYFKVQMGGKTYYATRDAMISDEEMRRAEQMLATGELHIPYKSDTPFQTFLNGNNRSHLVGKGIQVIPLWNFRQQNQPSTT